MGCGTCRSNGTRITNQLMVGNVVSDAIKTDSTLEHSQSTEIEKFVKVKVNITIVGHTNERHLAEKLRLRLVEKDISCILLDENNPKALKIRALTIKSCDLLLVLVSRRFQRTFSCMEALNYAKDIRKPTISILAEPTFEPYGALGAISASSLNCILIDDDMSNTHNHDRSITSAVLEILQVAQNLAKSDGINNSEIENSEIQKDVAIIDITDDSKSYTILICTTDDGVSVAQLIYQSLIKTEMSTIIEKISQTDVGLRMANYKVLVPILTPQLEQSPVCQKLLEQTRSSGKPIVPVIAIKKWRPDSWLGLIVAGRVFFRIFNEETAYQPFYDSNRMTDLRIEIEIQKPVALQPAPTLEDREGMEKIAIEEEIQRCKNVLKSWPPTRKPRIIRSLHPKQPNRIAIPEPHANSYFEHTHYSITRIDRKAPPAIVDAYGLPKRRILDCMISYQWDKQDLVHNVFQDLHMRQVQTWFDIWGSMQGGISEAMATGVECAKVLLVFLSQAYIESVNCQLEFRYAVQRGKAFVVLNTESNMKLERWMSEAIEGFPCFDVYCYDVLEKLINGVPLIDVIVQAIRALAEVQSLDIIDDCSSELFELRCLLDDARDELCAQTGRTRYKICTRCGKNYDEYFKDGCKKHREYFLGGGGLMEDQWVCCRQQSADSPGCFPCEHIDQIRSFVNDPRYGTSTWQPP